MKKLLVLFSFALALAAGPVASASNHTVASLTTGSAKTIIIVGTRTKWITITNVASGNQVNLGLDGGAAYTDPNTGQTGTDPATGAAGACSIWLSPGASVTLNGQQFYGIPIRAIMATGTTTLTIGVDDVGGSTFPTN